MSLTILVTLNDPLYPRALTPAILIGVSTFSSGKSFFNSTVIVGDAVTESPAKIEVIPTSSPLFPTISNSGLVG